MKQMRWFTAVLIAMACILLAGVACAAVEGDYTYEVADGKATITKYSGTETDVVVPDKLGGHPVVGISSGNGYMGAFHGNETIVNVWLPDSVTSIDDNSFYECKLLKRIDFSENVISIGEAAFFYCEALQDVGDVSNVTVIEQFTFCGCKSLTSIILCDRLTSIGESAFHSCTALKNVTIPSSITSIGQYVFDSSTNLCCAIGSNTAKLLSKNHYSYFADDLTLCYLYDDYGNENGLMLKKCQSASRTVSIPDCVTSIGASAFDGCTTLENVNIPYGVTGIGAYAFNGCTTLENVNIPYGVTGIGSYAFRYCSSLLYVDLPETIASIGNYAFSSKTHIPCPVGSNVAKLLSRSKCYFWTDNFCLQYQYDADGNENGLKACRYDGTSATARVPDGVSEVCYSWDSNTVKYLTIPEGVTTLTLEHGYDSMIDLLLPRNAMTFSTLDFYGTPTVYCYEYTTAHTWALEKGYPVVLLDGKTPPDYVTLTLPEMHVQNLGTPCDMRALLQVSMYPVEPIHIDWTSTNPSVATVDSKGNLTPVAIGTTTVAATVREYPTLTASTLVTIKKPIEAFDLPADVLLPVKSSDVMYVTNVQPADAPVCLTYTMANELIATVDEFGVVTGKSIGATTLTVTSDSGVVRTCPVTVTRPVTSVVVAPTTLTLYVGANTSITATATAGDQTFINRLVVFRSDDPTVATVDQQGRIVALKPGSTVVKATAGSGVFGECAVMVGDTPVLTLPADTTAIEARAFLNSGAVYAIVPSGCLTIGDEAFKDCATLVRVDIPASVTSIGTDAFAGCDRLSIHCPADSEAQRYAAANGIPTVND